MNANVKELRSVIEGLLHGSREYLPSREDLTDLLASATRGKKDATLMTLGVFAAGAVLGAGIAMLVTPRSGTEMRRELSEQLGNAREALAGRSATGDAE